MGTSLENLILAVVTTTPHKVGGGSPIFYANDEEELQKLSFTLEKIMDAMAHQLCTGTMIIVKHF
jgi:hypothetical protein